MKRRQVILIFGFVSALSFVSCKKNDEADILYYEIIDQEAAIDISESDCKINITFQESVSDAEDLVAGFILSDGAVATVSGVPQISGQTKNSYETSFSYLVQSEDKSNLIEWKVSASNNSITSPWGLGNFQQLAYANNKNYEWYLDQSNTGVHSENNCGPTSITMAAKWANQSFSKTPEDARAAYRPEGGWWYTSDVDKYLTDNKITHYFISLASNAESTKTILKAWLDEGAIAILCLDMYYIRAEVFQYQRVDKFYNANSIGWGHFIVVKGYRMVDDQFFFETYDPYCYSKTNSDGTLKGKDRYYRSTDIFTATKQWWNFAVIIPKSGSRKSELIGLDPSSIPNMWGR